MLRLIYDDDLENPVIDGYELAFKETINALTHILGDRKRKFRDYERKAIFDARQLLRLTLYRVDTDNDLCNNIGNLYINHFGERTPEDLTEGFEAGYNAAIRDALQILEKEGHASRG